ncbi:MAG: ABC transporter permease [Actinomycetota bacterium]|nr:ABC transporter permease [Actinomycetota bacterium]
MSELTGGFSLAGEIRRSWAISKKDIKIYYTKSPILIFGIIFPLALFFAFALGRDVPTELLIPGLVAMTVFFSTTTIAPFSVPWEIAFGNFERYFTAPITFNGLIMGKLFASFLYGVFISVVPLLVGLIGYDTEVTSVVMLVCTILVSALCFSALGMLFSTVRADTPPKVMLILNVVRLPMLFVSGIFVTIAEMPYWGRVLSVFSPLSYCSDLMYRSLGEANYFPLWLDFLALVAFGAVFYSVSVIRFRNRRR